MSDLIKTERLGPIRFSKEQARRIELAAAIQSQRKGEIWEPGSLFRDFGLERVNDLLAAASPTELEQAEAHLAEQEAASK